MPKRKRKTPKIPSIANTQQKKKRKAPWVESDVKRNDKGQFA